MSIKMGGYSYQKWQKGIRLTKQQQINAHCYQCNGLNESGEDCQGEKSCPFTLIALRLNVGDVLGA